MLKYISILSIFLFGIFFNLPSFAEDIGINTKSLDAEGYSEVSRMLKNMTPEQIAEVKRQAEAMRPELEAMSPQERQNLENQMHNTIKTVDTSKIDAKKLDVSKGKGLKGIQSDFQEYQKKVNK